MSMDKEQELVILMKEREILTAPEVSKELSISRSKARNILTSSPLFKVVGTKGNAKLFSLESSPSQNITLSEIDIIPKTSPSFNGDTHVFILIEKMYPNIYRGFFFNIDSKRPVLIHGKIIRNVTKKELDKSNFLVIINHKRFLSDSHFLVENGTLRRI